MLVISCAAENACKACLKTQLSQHPLSRHPLSHHHHLLHHHHRRATDSQGNNDGNKIMNYLHLIFFQIFFFSSFKSANDLLILVFQLRSHAAVVWQNVELIEFNIRLDLSD